MGHLPVIADTFRCAINWQTSGGQTAENVIHIIAPGKTVSAVAGALDTNTDPNMFLSMATAATAPSVTITPLDGTTATSNHTLTNWLGTASGEYVPSLSALLTLYTGTRGRSYRGRVFLPFTAENRQANGFWSDPTNPPAQAAAWDAWGTANDAAGFTWAVASYKKSTAAAVAVVASHLAFASQRRRQSRLKP